MKLDEFSFLNQQLAAMLESGLPLEGALRRLSETMARGRLRTELERLEGDLAKGRPLGEALAERNLPGLYVKMVRLGLEGNNLPGMLTFLADYYRQADAIKTRLRGLMVYPAIVLVAALGLFAFLGWMYSATFRMFMPDLVDTSGAASVLGFLSINVWLPAIVLLILAVAIGLASSLGRWRNWWRWHLPAFKEAALSQFASAMKLMLKGGAQLRDALGLFQELERDTAAGAEVQRWQKRLGEGHGKFADLAAGTKIFPPLFVWLVTQAGEDLADGFGRAAEVYYARAVFRVEMLLYAALPVAVLVLAGLVLAETVPLLKALIAIIDMLGGGG